MSDNITSDSTSSKDLPKGYQVSSSVILSENDPVNIPKVTQSDEIFAEVNSMDLTPSNNIALNNDEKFRVSANILHPTPLPLFAGALWSTQVNYPKLPIPPPPAFKPLSSLNSSPANLPYCQGIPPIPNFKQLNFVNPLMPILPQGFKVPSIPVIKDFEGLDKKKKVINCNYYAVSLIFNNNLQKPIEEKYNSKIVRKGNNIILSYESDDMLDEIEAELQLWIKQFTFDDEARWWYLENDEIYRLFDEEYQQIVEDCFRNSYYQIISPDYKEFSISCEFLICGIICSVEFSHIGGNHRMRKRKKNDHEIQFRDVKRSNNIGNFYFVKKYQWLWKHESGEFVPYDDESSFLIEVNYIEFEKKKISQK